MSCFENFSDRSNGGSTFPQNVTFSPTFETFQTTLVFTLDLGHLRSYPAVSSHTLQVPNFRLCLLSKRKRCIFIRRSIRWNFWLAVLMKYRDCIVPCMHVPPSTFLRIPSLKGSYTSSKFRLAHLKMFPRNRSSIEVTYAYLGGQAQHMRSVKECVYATRSEKNWVHLPSYSSGNGRK